MSNHYGGIKTVLVVVFAVLFISSASANVLIDSEDWRDVYTGMYQSYENWDRGEPYFVKSSSASNILSGDILPAGNVTVIESSDESFSGGMASRLGSQPEDYNIIETITVESAQTELIPENQEDFIVVPSDYPAAAVTAAPLARVMDSWVLMVEDENLDEVSGIVQNAEGQVLMVGSFSNDIETEIEQYSDEQIISQNPQNLSVQVVERFRQEEEFEEVMLTPGEQLSTELFLSERPVLITKKSPPLSDIIVEYVGETESITTLFLDNPEYSVVGSSLNDEVESDYDREISVFVHFGQARGDQSSISAPSFYPLPSSNANLLVDSVKYNPSRSQVLVKYRNPTDVKLYQNTESLNVLSDGESVDTGFDEESVLIDAESTRTVSYDIELDSSYLDTNLTASMTTSYGTNPQSLQNTLTNEGEFRPPYETDLIVENITDESNITLQSVKYMTNVERFKAVLENTGSVPAYATVDIRNVMVRGEEDSFTATSGEIEPGARQEVYITPNPALDRIDIQENDELSVVVNYGEEEGTQLNRIAQTVEFQTGSGIPVIGQFGAGPTSAAAVVVLLILAAVVEIRYSKISDVASTVRS